jgi:transposase
VKIMPHRRPRYIGLDVHRATIAVALAEEEGSPTNYGTIPNEPSSIRKLMVRLGGEDVQLHVAYEAGPTGYALHRQLTKHGIECIVVAPSRHPGAAGRQGENRSSRRTQTGAAATEW